VKTCVLILLLAVLVACKRDDMADQKRLKPLGPSPYFANGAASRVPPAHTIPTTGDADVDNTSWLSPTTATSFPFEITKADLLRGQERFEVNCVACHGYLGDGEGMVPQRGFLHPPTFHSDRLRAAPPSYIYDVMTKGIGAMFPYADRVSPDDRWRIAAYIRALQLADGAPQPAATGGKP